MLVGTLAYVARDNFQVGAATREGTDADAQTLVEQSQLLLDQGDEVRALDHARRAVQAGPDFLPGHMMLVSILVQVGDLDGARSALALAELLAPDDPSVESARRLLDEGARPAH